MFKKSIVNTEAGEITTWLVGEKRCSTCRITAFRMSDEFAKKNNRTPMCGLTVAVWDFSDWGWKEVITGEIFTYSEVREMLRKDTVLPEVQKMLKDYFNIEISI